MRTDVVASRGVALATLTIVAWSGCVNAQQVPAGTPGQTTQAPDTGAALTEVVVTAQRREESSQHVPVAVTAFTAEQMQDMGAQTTADLPLLIPGFKEQPVSGGQAYYLRGVGTNITNPGFDSEVATYIDGVYMPFQIGNIQGFNNVARIEVDKGPQGTLFGRNATGGVIQINTKDPQAKPALDIEAGYGNYQTANTALYATTGITDSIATNLAAYFYDQSQGFGRDFATGREAFRNYNVGLRNKWLFQPSDSTDIRLSLDYANVRGNAGTDITPVRGQHGIYDEVTNQFLPIACCYNLESDIFPGYDAHTANASLKIETDLGWAQLRSTTAYNFESAVSHIDYDGTPVNFLAFRFVSREQAESQELQLLSGPGSPINWAAGFFFYNEMGEFDPDGFQGLLASIAFGAPPGGEFDLYGKEHTRSYATYTQATAKLMSDTRLTLGVRYTMDTREIGGHNATSEGVVVPSTVGSQSVNFDKTTFRAALDHDLTADVLAYVSANRGFHSGAFNIANVAGYTAAADPPVKPETIDAYELGIKSQWFDNRLRLNASGFIYHYSDLQTVQFENNTPVTVNAAEALIKGIDVDAMARPAENLFVSAALELLNARYTSYPNAPHYTTDPGTGAIAESSVIATGNMLPQAPRVTYTLSGAYTLPAGDLGKFVSSATVAYNRGFYSDPSNFYFEPAYYLVNMSESWTDPGDTYGITLWVANLANTYYDTGISILAPVGAVSNPGSPRTFGVTFKMHF